jgi:hypothetical protein
MSINLQLRIVIASVAASACIGCGASAPPKQGTSRVEPASSKSPYDFRKEGVIPPASGGDARPEADVEEIAVSDSGLTVSDAEAPPVDTTRTAVVADSLADGFRIQVFATADREIAENARAAAAERLGVPAYLDLEGGVYKVRVGDYVVRPDADRALSTVRGHYYPDAWVVASRVKVPRNR